MAPERIGGGDYSYPADVWSFGLAMISVALGRYPLPTQDGFFGLVDFCVTHDPIDRPSADALLQHPFIYKYTAEETLEEWTSFIDRVHLCEERRSELESLSDAVYRHMYEHSVKFSHTPQSDSGVSFVSQATPMFCRRQVSLRPVQVSWTASPGISRRQQFGIGTDSPQRTPRERGSFWRKLQESMSKLGHSKRRKERERRRSAAAL
uniref:mitogen-activated protein kinase kinase n=1 Tax=Hyaloperonospora arabidopsidis (strain Emoy2) TaxID=559515 RepID=M4BMA5_HYAAE